MGVVLNDFRAQWADVQQQVHAAVARVGESGWLILGKEVEAFEAELATHWGLSHAVGCANGLDAIEIGLRALGLRAGDAVLTTPLTAFATTLAILRAGGKPVFADVDEAGLLDLDAAERVIEQHGIRFLVPVHLYGHAMPLARLRRLAALHDLRVVEDCAQAIGARSGGLPVGSVGQVAATSFYPTKNLGAYGDGGAVLTQDADLDRSIRQLRDYGQSAKYKHTVLGLNSRLDELQAAILRDAMLPRLEAWTHRRKSIAQRYLTEISNPSIRLPVVPPESESVWHLFPLRVDADRRDAFMGALKSVGIASGIHYPILVTDQDAYRSATGGTDAAFPVARAWADTEVSIPIHPYLSDDDVGRVVEACNGWQAG